MFKLGSNHTVRGLTRTHIYDLGNTVTEMAAINESGSTHIRLTGAKGTTYNMLAGLQDFDDSADWHDWIREALIDKLDAEDSDYLLVDLRPLRKLRMKNVDQELKDLVFGFDMWIIITNASGVTPIGNQ